VSTVAAPKSDHVGPEPVGPLTDEGLLGLMKLGLTVGTPVLYLFALGMVSLAGVGLDNALAIAIIPALFGGITAGGFVGLMVHLRKEDRAGDAARSAEAARRALPKAA
jgi:hypothetical protein